MRISIVTSATTSCSLYFIQTCVTLDGMITARSITEVISHLDNIIAWSQLNQNRIGYFATLYRRMTIAVQQGIQNSSFEDGSRMEQLDVIFANRYLQAWEAYINKQKCTNAWGKTFDACNSNNLIVLQHLILGINTHINLDLAIAAAQTCPGEKIYALQGDFEKINGVIASISQDVQDKLAGIWFPLRLLKKFSNKREEAVLNFSINAARKTSWANGVALALVQGQAHSNYIDMIDNSVVNIASRTIQPGLMVNFILWPVRMMESKNVGKIIDILKN